MSGAIRSGLSVITRAVKARSSAGFAGGAGAVLISIADKDKRAAAQVAKRFEALEASLLEVSAEIRSRVEEAGLKGQTVLASGHQVEFARWLGLEAAAVFQGADSMTPSQIAQCLEAGRQAKVKIIIATLQEGAELPRRLAEQLNARLVVFSNFPDLATDAESRFVQMLQNNINALIP